MDNKQHMTTSCGTKTEEVQQKEELLSAERRFMVYICGGYKGEKERILKFM